MICVDSFQSDVLAVVLSPLHIHISGIRRSPLSFSLEKEPESSSPTCFGPLALVVSGGFEVPVLAFVPGLQLRRVPWPQPVD